MRKKGTSVRTSKKKEEEEEDEVLQVAIYTSEFLQERDDAKDSSLAYDAAWTRLLRDRPNLYFDVMPTLSHHNTSDKSPKFCSLEHLQDAARIVEERTLANMKAQSILLHKWKRGATHFQRLYRGFKARQIYFKVRMKHNKKRMEAHFQMALTLLRIKRSICARLIQRTIQRFLGKCHLQTKASFTITRYLRLYSWRCIRYNAALKIGIWYQNIQYGRAIFNSLKLLRRAMKLVQRDEAADEAVKQYFKVKESQRNLRQQAYFHLKPDAVMLGKLIGERKHQLEIRQNTRELPLSKDTRTRQASVNQTSDKACRARDRKQSSAYHFPSVTSSIQTMEDLSILRTTYLKQKGALGPTLPLIRIPRASDAMMAMSHSMHAGERRNKVNKP